MYGLLSFKLVSQAQSQEQVPELCHETCDLFNDIRHFHRIKTSKLEVH